MRRSTIHWALAMAGLLCTATLSAPARAQDAQTQAMGRALFNEGMSLFNDGRHAEACPKFEASLKSYPGIGTRGKLAECYEKVGRYASAWAQYREVAQLATRTGDVTREQVASERAKALEPKLSYVTVVVAHPTPGLVVKRNGREVERGKYGSAEPVDSGAIAFEVSAPGKKTFTAQVTVTQGQSARFEVPTLEATNGTNASVVTAPPPPSNTAPPPVYEDGPTWHKPVGLALIGVGLAGVGVGAYFGLKARSTYDGAFTSGGCISATKECDVAGQAAVDDARSRATISTVLFAAGGAVALGGVILFLVAPSATVRSGHASPVRQVRLAPATMGGGPGLLLSGTL